MTVREILQECPQSKEVFDKYGLSGCGGSEGPAEPLSFFARVHQVDEEKLLSELVPFVCEDETPDVEEAPKKKCRRAQIKAHPELYTLFLKASLAFLIFGSSLGLVNMLLMLVFASLGVKTSFAWGTLWAHIMPIHGHIQLFGFAAMFIMGIAYHVVPRFLMTELSNEKMARLSFYLMVFGVALTVVLSDVALRFPAPYLPAGGVFLEVIAVSLFIFVIMQTAKKSAAPPALHTKFLRYGSIWLFTGTLSYFLSFAILVFSSESSFAPVFKEASIYIILFGFIFLFIFGVALRTLHLFMGLREPVDAISRVVLILINAGLVSYVLQLFIAQKSVLQITLLLFSSAAAFLSGMLMVYNLRMFIKPEFDLKGAPVPRDYEKYVRGAFAWLGAGLLMYFVSQVLSVSGSDTISQSLFLSARHILTIGFMAQMIFGMASRIVPVFQGVELKSARILNASFYLLNAGVLIRVVFQILSGNYGMALYPGVAVSGTLHFIVFVMLSYNIWATMGLKVQEISAKVQPSPEKNSSVRKHDITPETIVWNVINDYPQTLDVFLKFGLDKLKNPVLRNTMARTVTIQMACKVHNVDVNLLVPALRESAGLTAPQKKIEQEAQETLVKV